MANKEIVNKAREFRAEGKTEEQITAALFNMGLSDEEVKEIISESAKAAPELNTEEAKDKKSAKSEKKKKKWWPF